MSIECTCWINKTKGIKLLGLVGDYIKRILVGVSRRPEATASKCDRDF
jgi:hypothetical protein